MEKMFSAIHVNLEARQRSAPFAALWLGGAIAVGAIAGPAHGELLLYEPFDYPDEPLNGKGGALGTTGTWTTNDTGEPQGWWCHPEGELTGQGDDLGPGGDALNLFDGTVENLATTGGFAGPAGPTDQSSPGVFGMRDQTGNLDAHIGIAPGVTATFQAGTTTWFSYVGCHADNRNQGSPTFMLCTDPTTNGSRGLNLQNAGDGIGGVGGPTRFNLFDVYPHYFSGGIHHQSPGGYLGGVLGDHNGIVTSFCSTPTCDGVLGDDATRAWVVRDADGFMGVPNIVVGKIEWDADENGEDVVTVASFLETDDLTEEAFDALIAAQPLLSSRNWPAAATPADPANPSNKPDLDQSQFDTLNISSLKFWVDEIRVGTSFKDVVKSPTPTTPLQLTITDQDPDLEIAWESQPGMFYVLRSNTDLEADLSGWESVNVPGSVENDGVFEIATNPPLNTHLFPRPDDETRFYRVVEQPLPPVVVLAEDFEGGAGEWTNGSDGAAGTAWELGEPSNVGPTAAHSPLNCFATNISADYEASANVWLRSPAIDLTTAAAATLSYWEFRDIEEGFDFATLSVLDAADDSAIAVLEDTIDGTTGDWEEVTVALPAEALGKSIKIEFRFQSDDLQSFAGWYLDDVLVTSPAQ